MSDEEFERLSPRERLEYVKQGVEAMETLSKQMRSAIAAQVEVAAPAFDGRHTPKAR